VDEGVTNYPWYEVVHGAELTQGDLIPACPVLVPNAPDDVQALESVGDVELETGVARQDVVVMTQACDLAHDKVAFVALCPVWTLDEFSAENQPFASARAKDRIRQGQVPAYHMLAGHGDTDAPISVVEFHQIFSLPKGYLRAVAQNAGPRLRLLPPYREHLAQAFARYFMRVGLPVDIPAFN